MTAQPSIPRTMTLRGNPKLILLRLTQLIIFVAIMGAILFGLAGTFRWFGAWAFLIAYIVIIFTNGIFFIRQNSGLIEERSKIQPGVKRWDRWIVNANTLVGMLFPMVVAGLDRRFHWSSVPFVLMIAALAIYIAAYAFTSWAMYVNRFFSGYVRIQTERGHEVIRTGPYRLIRHPGYVGLTTSMIAIPVLLGSWWALVPAGIGFALIVLRTYLEDKTLQEELPGYKEYAQAVRYRLVPGIW